MEYMFIWLCRALIKIFLHWDVSNVSNMIGVFVWMQLILISLLAHGIHQMPQYISYLFSGASII